MKWGSSGRAKRVLSNGPTLRSISFFLRRVRGDFLRRVRGDFVLFKSCFW